MMLFLDGTPTQVLEKALAGLVAGDNLWFWMPPQPVSDYPPILIQSWIEDPEAEYLMDVALESGDLHGIVGAGRVERDGHIVLSSPDLHRGLLDQLALWMRHEVTSKRGLAGLLGMQFEVLDDDGGVVRTLETNRWPAMPPAAAPGSPGHAMRVLAELGVGESARVWVAGPMAPTGVVTAQRDDPSGVDHQRLVGIAQLGRPPGSEHVGAALRREADGSLLLVTEDDAKRVAAGVDAFVRANQDASPRLAELLACTVVRRAKGEIIEAVPPRMKSQNCRKEVAALKAMRGKGVTGVWWVTTRSASGMPRLLIRKDNDALKEAAAKVGGDGRTARGHIRFGKGGRAEFRTARDHELLLENIAAWATAHATAFPGLRLLTGATVVVADRDGKVVARRAAPWAWTALGGRPPTRAEPHDSA